MTYAPLVRRIATLWLAVSMLLPATCFAKATTSNSKTIHPLLLTAQATTSQAPPCTASPSTATITLPSPISIAAGTANGLIGSAASTTVSIDCMSAFNATTNWYDNFSVLTGNLAALDSANAPPGGKGIMLQTNVPGIDVLLTATPTQASNGNNGPNSTPGWVVGKIDCTSGTQFNNTFSCSNNPLSATFTAQLVKTGPISPGTINSIQLLQLYDSDQVPNNPSWYPHPITTYNAASNAYGTLMLSAVTVNMSSCSVIGPNNLSVPLPTITNNALPTTGSVAGQTSFNIQYKCPSGWALYMTMSTTNPGTATGVIKPSASCSGGAPASNVGIQLLQGNQQPVPFDTAKSLGSSPNGTLSLTYYAQYYATASPIGTGQVCGTATFTMSYQ